MSISALQFLWQIEEDLEKEFKRILADATANVYRSLEKVSGETPWLEITFQTGRVQGHQKVYPSGVNTAIKFYDTWIESQLLVTVCTQRQNNSSQHAIILGRLRAALQLASLAGTWQQETHAITDCREAGTQRGFNSDDDTDSSQVTFTVCHNIKYDAWPESLNPDPPTPPGDFAFLPSDDLAFLPADELAFV